DRAKVLPGARRAVRRVGVALAWRVGFRPTRYTLLKPALTPRVHRRAARVRPAGLLECPLHVTQQPLLLGPRTVGAKVALIVGFALIGGLKWRRGIGHLRAGTPGREGHRYQEEASAHADPIPPCTPPP